MGSRSRGIGSQEYRYIVTESAKSIIQSLFDEAGETEPTSLVAAPLRRLWESDSWTAESIQAEFAVIGRTLEGGFE